MTISNIINNDDIAVSSNFDVEIKKSDIGLSDLPNELLIKIFSYLSAKDRSACSQVSTHLGNVCLQVKENTINYVLQELGQELKKMVQYIPARYIAKFNRNKITAKDVVANLDPTRIHAYNLGSLYRVMAAPFCFDVDVRNNYDHSIRDLDIESSLSKCLNMAKRINAIANDVLDRNLPRVWERVVQRNSEIPQLQSAKQIREWLDDSTNQSKIEKVTWLDLTRSDIELIPPEVNLFSNLRKVYTQDSELWSFPTVFHAHSILSNSLKNVECADLKFYLPEELRF